MNESFTPAGAHTVTPRIVARDAGALVDFIKHVFGATGDYSPERPAELRIGDSTIMISDAGVRGPMPAFLYVYVEDVGATYARALEAGAVPVEAPAETPYGHRRAMVEDRWGNAWQIARPLPSAAPE